MVIIKYRFNESLTYPISKKVSKPNLYPTTADLRQLELNVIVILYGHPILKKQRAIDSQIY